MLQIVCLPIILLQTYGERPSVNGLSQTHYHVRPNDMRFLVMDMKIIVFLVMTSYILIQTLNVEATFSCKMLINSYKVTLCYIPDESNYEASVFQLAFSVVSRCALW
jgi:hypothetical protein